MQNDRRPQNQQLAAALDTRTKNPVVGLNAITRFLSSMSCCRSPAVGARTDYAFQTRTTGKLMRIGCA